MPRAFHAHARTVTLLTAASRVGGLARDAAMSRVFGAGATMDAFAFAFLVPNLFRRLFGEGALTAAFLPAYALWSDRDPAVAARLAWLVVGGAAVLLSALVLGAELLVAGLRAGGAMDPLGGSLLMAMLPYAPLVCLTALLGAMLQSHHRFGPTAAAPILLNLLLVAASLAAVWLDPAGEGRGIRLAAGAVLLAGVLQVAWSLLVLRRVAPLRPGRPSAEASAAARGVAVRALPMILGLGVLQLNGLVDGLVASWPTLVGPTILGTPYPLGEGSMAQLGWAQRLYEFPLGVFGIAVATAIFPALSRLAVDPAAFTATLRRGIRLVLFIGLPASAGLMLVAEPIAAVVLQGRAFTAENAAITASILLGYAPAVWAYSLNQVLVRAFYARGDAMTPVRVAVTLVGLNLALNLTLIWTPLGIAGLAWSTAICALVQAAALGTLLSRRLDARLFDAAVGRSLLRSVLLTAAMAAAVGGTLLLLPAWDSWSGQALRLAAGVAVGGGIVLIGAARLGMPELGWSLGRRDGGDSPDPSDPPPSPDRPSDAAPPQR